MLPIRQSVRRYLRENLEILACYFSLGLLLQLPVTVMRFFLVDRMQLGPAMLASVAALFSFPWAVKPATAFLSEKLISKCLRRSRQVALAYALAGLCWFGLLLLPTGGGGGSGPFLLTLFYGTLASFFISFADVCQDACMVRRIHRDSHGHGRGRLQSFVLAARAFGSLVGSLLSGLLALLGPIAFLCIALCHFVGVASGLRLRTQTIEQSAGRVHKTTCCVACRKIVEALVWGERLLFIAVLCVLALPLSDFALMQYYFQKTMGVQPIAFAVSDALSYIAMIAASLIFNARLRGRPWKATVMLSQAVLFVVIASNLLLLTGYTHFNSTAYLLLRGTIGSFFGHLGFMPLAVKAADLVPEGLEGTFYSLYMSTVNMGSVLSEELSAEATRALRLEQQPERVPYFYLIVILGNMFALFILHLAYDEEGEERLV